MDRRAEALAAAIGGRVRTERQSRRWTLEQFAQAAGVSRRMLINVEQGSANPSVGTLLRISEALGVGLSTLVEPPEPRTVKVTRSGEGAVLWNGQFGGRGTLVSSTDTPDVVELWDWTMGPGDGRTSEAHTPGTKELLQVLEGTLTIEVGGRAHELGPGDALTFPGDVAHVYANRGGQPARFLLTVFEPAMGSRPRKEESDA